MTDEQIRMNVLSGRQIDGQRVGQLVVGQGPVVASSAARPRPRRRPTRARSSSARPSRAVSPLTSAVRGLLDQLLGLFLGQARRRYAGCARPRSWLLPADLSKTPWVFSSPLSGVVGRVEVAVGVVRAAGAEHDVRADQTGEEHHFRGQEQPHRDLAGRDRRMVVRCGRWPAPCAAGSVAVELWVATAIVITTLGA